MDGPTKSCACIEVHRTLGPGLLENVYQDCLALEFSLQNIPFQAVDNLVPVHKAQALAYIKLTGCKLGVLINFNVPVLKDGIEWLVLDL